MHTWQMGVSTDERSTLGRLRGQERACMYFLGRVSEGLGARMWPGDYQVSDRHFASFGRHSSGISEWISAGKWRNGVNTFQERSL
jgi:hypothetical protein